MISFFSETEAMPLPPMPVPFMPLSDGFNLISGEELVEIFNPVEISKISAAFMLAVTVAAGHHPTLEEVMARSLIVINAEHTLLLLWDHPPPVAKGKIDESKIIAKIYKNG